MRDVLMRHWPLAVAALILTGGAMFQVTSVVKPEYRASGSTVLIPPKSIEDPQSNRYLALGTLDQAVGVVKRSLLSEPTVRSVKASAPDGTYEVAPDYTTSAPIMVVTATGHSREGTQRVLRAALAAIPTVVDQLQTSIGVEPGEQITTLGLTRDRDASLVLKPVIRAMLAVGVVVLGVLLGLIVLIDGLQLRRRARRGQLSTAQPTEADTTADRDTDESPDEDTGEVTSEEAGEEAGQEPGQDDQEPGEDTRTVAATAVAADGGADAVDDDRVTPVPAARTRTGSEPVREWVPSVPSTRRVTRRRPRPEVNGHATPREGVRMQPIGTVRDAAGPEEDQTREAG